MSVKTRRVSLGASVPRDAKRGLGSELRSAFRRLATGVCIVTAPGPDGPAGMTCSSVVSVSLEPPLVLFCPAKSSSTWPVMRPADHFAVNVLGGDAVAVARRFAMGEDHFAGMSWRAGQTGSPLLGDAIVWIECRTRARHDGGDHEIVIGEVVSVEAHPGQPLVFHDGELFALSAARAAA